MRRTQAFLTRFLTWSAKKAGSPITFMLALSLILLWLITGLIFGFSTQSILILDTIATVNATLMVFIIHNTQYRENKALHLKIDELIRVTREAENELIAIEESEEAKIEELRKRIMDRLRDIPKT